MENTITIGLGLVCTPTRVDLALFLEFLLLFFCTFRMDFLILRLCFYVCTKRPECRSLLFFLFFSPYYFFRWGLSFNQELTNGQNDWPMTSCYPPNLHSCHTSSMLALQKPSTQIDFYTSTRDPNSGCHTCPTDTLLMSQLPPSTIPWTIMEL